MAQFTGLDNKGIINNAVASGLENFEINGNKIFDGSGEYHISQVIGGVSRVKIIHHDKSHNGRESYAKWTITIQENPTPIAWEDR